MKNKDLVNLSKEELISKEKEFKKKLFELNRQRYGQRVEKPHMFSLLKRDIARIETLLTRLNPKVPQATKPKG